jgi:hypothetical protein
MTGLRSILLGDWRSCHNRQIKYSSIGVDPSLCNFRSVRVVHINIDDWTNFIFGKLSSGWLVHITRSNLGFQNGMH